MFQINHVKRTVLSVVLGAIVMMVSVLSGVLLTHAQGSEDCRTFPETGHKVCGKFLTYWDSHGGLAQQGFPISETFTENSPLDGKPYTVQYFERAVFELHPENQHPYDVLLSQLGTFVAKQKYTQGFPATGGVPYYEDRLDPATFIESFYNAINRKEYDRAYSYFQPGAPDVPTYADFVAGYADTASVMIYTGKIEVNAGAGNLYANVPTVLVATHTDGSVHTYAACYILHRTNAGIDPNPDAVLWKLMKGTATEDTANTPVATLLAEPCGP